MMSYKISAWSSCLVAAAVAIGLALVSGCGKKPEVYPLEGNAYMKDPTFRASLRKQEKARDVLTADRARTLDALKKLLDKLGSPAAVTNTAEGMALYLHLLKGEEAFTSNRMETAAIIRARMQQAQKDSELIKAGKAVAVKVEDVKNLKK